jgi:hypothetical protein
VTESLESALAKLTLIRQEAQDAADQRDACEMERQRCDAVHQAKNAEADRLRDMIRKLVNEVTKPVAMRDAKP